MNRIRVPLAVDAQLRIPLGPVQLPVRTCIALGIAIVPTCIAFELPLSIALRISAATFVVGLAVMAATPTREGLWVGTYRFLRLLSRWLPTRTEGGSYCIPEQPLRSGWRRFVPHVRLPEGAIRWLAPTSVVNRDDGLMELKDGGWRSVLLLDGPPTATESKSYARWCESVMQWLHSLEVSAQVVTIVGHVNREQAENTFSDNCTFQPTDGPLVLDERDFAGQLAVRSLAFTHYVVLAPRQTSVDGVPRRFGKVASASRTEAEHVMASAISGGKANGLGVERASAEQMATLLKSSTLGAAHTTSTRTANTLGDKSVGSLVVTGLGADATWGMLVDVIQRSGMHGAVSLHLLPASRATVRRQLNRRRLWLRYALREGKSDIDLEVSLQDTERLQADIAAGKVEGLRIALTLRVLGKDEDSLSETVERLRAILGGHGWKTETITAPALAASSVGAPGTPPLRRSTLLTTDSVAARLLPALGTPFATIGDPIVGLNLRTGSSAYLSVFSRPNFNAVIVGSSGSGKSVTAKTLLIRHVMRGCGACVLDPDSEYATVIKLLGGHYFELPQAALNPLALGVDESCDMAAGRIIPVLSVMAGDETEYVGGRPIRRLASEDKALLHRSLRAFLNDWRSTNQGEPLLREFIDHLEGSSAKDRALPARGRQQLQRVALRLSGYTQGQLGEIFDRPSTFAIAPGQVIGIGFRSLSLSYAADLTPALCVVLSHVLDAILAAKERMVVLVDEAHVLTSDPDAGQVLEQLVRRARKCRAGVWMASQKVDEFTSSALGKTLAATAATKVVLGHEDTVAEQVRTLFDLAEDESSALTPPVAGRAVLISGNERTIVQVQPSPLLWGFVGTSEETAA